MEDCINNYNFDNHATSVLMVAMYPSLAEYRLHAPYVVIPAIPESQEFAGARYTNSWYNNYCASYRSDYHLDPNCYEYKVLDNPIMFEFHCQELISNGVLAKRFGARSATPAQAGGGEHEHATLIDMYTKQLLKTKEQLELFDTLVHKHDNIVKGIRDILSTIGYLDKVFDRKHHPLSQLNTNFTILKQMSINKITDEYDLSKYFPIVSDKPSDDELLDLYNQYPEYNTVRDIKRLCIPGSDKDLYENEFPDKTVFVVRVTKDILVKVFHGRAETFKTHDAIYYLNTPPFGSYISHVVSDAKMNALADIDSFDHIIRTCEEFFDTHPDCVSKDWLRKFKFIKQLRDKEYLLLKFNKHTNMIE